MPRGTRKSIDEQISEIDLKIQELQEKKNNFWKRRSKKIFVSFGCGERVRAYSCRPG